MKRFYTLIIAILCTITVLNSANNEVLKFSHATIDAKASKIVPLQLEDSLYTEWESFGEGTLSDEYSLILTIFNNYREDGDEEIVFSNKTQVFERSHRTDKDIKQFKFCNFLGYNDIIATYNEATFIANIESTPTGIPIPTGLIKDFGAESINFYCSRIEFSPYRKVFTLLNPWFFILGNSGFKVQTFTISFSDSKNDIGFSFTQKSGGVKSTDKSITYAIESNGVDHIKYITRYNDSFLYSEIDSISNGTYTYKKSSTEATINFSEGAGIYRILALPFDEDNNYLGFYKTINVRSNLAPEGTWESIGKGVWHHPYPNSYYYRIPSTEEYATYEFPKENMKWEVEIEKRTDTDREIYRVVNPYNSSCGLAEDFNKLFDIIYTDTEVNNRPSPFKSDDDYWFVFDVTEKGNFSFENSRPNGTYGNYFLPDYFLCSNDNYATETIFKDKCLRIPNFYNSDLCIEMPGFKGFGFEHKSDNDGNIYGNISDTTNKVYYILIPAQEEKPSEEEFSQEAKRIVNGESYYTVYTEDGSSAENNIISLPYKKYISSPSWMLVVPVDNNGNAFDYSVIPISYTEQIKNVTLDECLLAGFNLSNRGTFTNLTVTKTTSPQNIYIDTYTLPSPYTSSRLDWYELCTINTKPVNDWKFSHNRYNDSIEYSPFHTGICINNFWNRDDIFLIIISDKASIDGDNISFHLESIRLDGYTNTYAPENDNYFVFNLSGKSNINDILTNEDYDSPIEYYDLQGKKVINPTSGIYIRKQGHKTSKIIIK